MKFGLNKEQYNFIYEQVVKNLEKNNAQIWCFGSRARGDHKEFSDLDLMVYSNKDLNSEIGLIIENLSKSNFPFKVDIIQYKDFAENYKQSFEADKKLF